MGVSQRLKSEEGQIKSLPNTTSSDFGTAMVGRT